MTREEAIRILASSCIPGSKQTEALETLIPELAESGEQKARAYDEALERAQKATRAGSDVAMDIVQYIFPQLAESEDERIRKFICSIIDNLEPKDFVGVKKMDVIAWLERQKVKVYDGTPYYTPEEVNAKIDEPINVIPKIPRQEYLYHLLANGIITFSDYTYLIAKKPFDYECANIPQKDYTPVEQKPAESISQLTVQGKGVYKICPRCKERMIRDNTKVYTSMPPQYGYKCPKCGEIEFDAAMYDSPEMEEQKPADLSEMMVHKEPYVAPVPTPMVVDEQKPIDYDAELEKCKHNYLYFWDKYVTVKLKPAKWSKEDEEMLQSIIKDFRDGNISSIGQEQWLKSLPERFNLQPKQEWSKEETKDLVHILKVLDDCYAYGKHNLSKTDHDNLTSTLKSLRPSWRPNEEELNLLRYLAKGIDVASHERHVLDNMIDKLKRL